jgi:hypothetical protein
MVDIGANALGRCFEIGEVVGVFLEEIRNGVGCQVEGLGLARPSGNWPDLATSR